MSAGYDALRESAALLDLNARGRFRMTGEDRARLLHAMSTNHIQQLQPGQGCYAFFLNAQGRILSDAMVLCFEDYLLIDAEAEAHDTLYQHLDKYIIADDVTLEDAREDTAVFAIEGPTSAAMLDGAPLPTEEYAHTTWQGAVIARASVTGAPGYRLYVPRAEADAFRQRFDAPLASPEDILAARLEHHKPRYGEDITDRYLPHETQQLHALHFSKGCYLGQEIVERVRSRGQVHRLLTPLAINGPAPARGAHLHAGEKDAGEITSAAWSLALGKSVALAYLRADYTQPGTTLTIDGAQAEVLPR